jgi:hypothetical protein
MNITPVIPDGYNGPVKQLTCRICKHLFYLTMADYERLREVSYCHECSLILLEELERNWAAPSSTAPRQAPRPLLSRQSKHRPPFTGPQNQHPSLPGHLSAFRSPAASTGTR